MSNDQLKTRPIFVCSACAPHGCTLIVDTCEGKPTNCPFVPKVGNGFADWFEMKITEEVATNENKTKMS